MASSLGAAVNVAAIRRARGRIRDGEEGEQKLMTTKMALVNYNKCHPEKCDSGVCAAALACSHKLLRQETLYDIPMTDSSICQGCGDCVRAYPLKAIEIVMM
jgi:Fe-S-cluster-containing hydrogenase component 2